MVSSALCIFRESLTCVEKKTTDCAEQIGNLCFLHSVKRWRWNKIWNKINDQLRPGWFQYQRAKRSSLAGSMCKLAFRGKSVLWGMSLILLCIRVKLSCLSCWKHLAFTAGLHHAHQKGVQAQEKRKGEIAPERRSHSERLNRHVFLSSFVLIIFFIMAKFPHCRFLLEQSVCLAMFSSRLHYSPTDMQRSWSPSETWCQNQRKSKINPKAWKL